MTDSPNARPPIAEPGKDESDKVERLGPLGVNIRNEARRQRDADQADRHIDDENPMPGRVGGDETAERRTADRADQGR